MRVARLEAIKRSVQSGVTIDYQTRTAIAFVDEDENRELTPGERTLGQIVLPRNVDPWGPEDGAAGGVLASVGFPENAELEGTALFDSTGRAFAPDPPWGAFRLKARDKNYFEIRVFPPATGRIGVRKWVGGDHDLDASWRENGQGGKAWRWHEPGEEPTPP
jgi:hypothetical protein